jgi:hypothetical protein
VKVATIAVPDLSPARFHQAIFRVFCINRIGKGQGVEHQIFSFRSPGDAPRSDSETGLMLDFARFEAGHLLADNWLRLERYACLPTQTLGFVEALAGTLLEPEDIAVFVGRGPQGIAALIPLCREPKGTARWRLAGAREVFEPGDALCDGEEGAALLAQALVRDGRPLDLDRIPASSLLIPALREAMRGAGCSRCVRRGLARPSRSMRAGGRATAFSTPGAAPIFAGPKGARRRWGRCSMRSSRRTRPNSTCCSTRPSAWR